MGYIKGILGKNGHPNYVPIVSKVKTSKSCLGYFVVAPSLPTYDLLKYVKVYEKVYFVVGGVQITFIEEKPPADCAN